MSESSFSGEFFRITDIVKTYRVGDEPFNALKGVSLRV